MKLIAEYSGKRHSGSGAFKVVVEAEWVARPKGNPTRETREELSARFCRDIAPIIRNVDGRLERVRIEEEDEE